MWNSWFFGSHEENVAEGLIPDLFFVFFKFFYMKYKQVVIKYLVSVCFVSPRLGDTMKTNCTKFQTVDPEICSISIFQKRILD